MIPVSLRLRNFMCYRDNVPPLSFEDFHVVCLSGDNGHGKSALLDALTWSLWKKTRLSDTKHTEDELIHKGKIEMEVEFEFDLGGNRYRVIRKLSLKSGKKGTETSGLLDLQILADGKYQSIAGNSIGETERKISEILRMDYDTFRNSAFLRQGRADEFTIKPPGDRKKVLADILGLGYYDELVKRAKEQADRCELERREALAALKEIDNDLARKPEYERQLAFVQGEVKSLENAIKAVEVEIAALQSRKRELDIKSRQVADLNARIAQAQREVAEIEVQIGQHQRRIAEFEKVLSERASIEAGYTRFVDARDANAHLNEKMAQLMHLRSRETELARAVAEAKSALDADKKVLASNAEQLHKRSIQAIQLEKQLSAFRSETEALLGLDATRDERREFVQSCRSQIELLKATNAQLKQDMISLKEKLELLSQPGAFCPLCESDLGPSGRDNLKARLEEEGRRMGTTWRDNDAQAKKLEREAQMGLDEIARIEKSLKDREALQRQVVMFEKSLADAREAEEQLTQVRKQLDDVIGRLERGDYARREQEELANVRAQMLSLEYDEARHREVKQLASALQEYEGLKSRVETAAERVGEERAAMERVRKAEARWRAVLDDDTRQRDQVRSELRDLLDLEQKLHVAQQNLEESMAQQARARQELGQAQQMLNFCRSREQQREEKLAAQVKASQEKAIWDELRTSFGKNGVQAMIIESAIPEIEQEANSLLAKMTDGRLHVTLETQREKKGSDEVTETLDIRVADELGLRRYESYSGGEAFRVNLALRIALSKLLARRAGVRLQTLVIDEGFGTQDSFGRERLVEAINGISGDFEKIIVITHIQDLKDAFPARIDVVKDVDGSRVEVATY